MNGFFMLLIGLGFITAGILFIIRLANTYDTIFIPLFIVTLLTGIFIIVGVYVVAPNKSIVLIFFGKYIGTVRKDGFHWSNPLASKKGVSLRIRNFNCDKLKVNDAAGNPIEIAAVIVWRVVDTARAMFDVDRYEDFVAIQSETAVRAMAMRYHYDSDDTEGEISLRGNPEEVAETLRTEVSDRLASAGVEVMEARISHLAYAPEIAQAMLRRQQAQAIIAARKRIVDGAVGMVEMALTKLNENNIVKLDEDKKATMVNNLMVALVSEQATQPIINTGTVYG